MNGEDQTKYSLVKEDITPAESRMESACTNKDSPVPFSTIQNNTKGEIDDASDTEEEYFKPSSASSLKLQALNGEYHVLKEDKSNLGNSANAINGYSLNETHFNEMNNNLIDVIPDETNLVDNLVNGEKKIIDDTFNAKILAQNVLKDIIEDDNNSDLEALNEHSNGVTHDSNITRRPLVSREASSQSMAFLQERLLPKI